MITIKNKKKRTKIQKDFEMQRMRVEDGFAP